MKEDNTLLIIYGFEMTGDENSIFSFHYLEDNIVK